MRRGLGTSLALMAAIACLPGVAGADVLKPTRFDDPVPNGCKPGDCSLREAIVAANKTDRGDTVKLRKGKYTLEIPEGGSDNAKDGDLDLLEKVTVTGKGPKKTTVDGNGIGPVFQLLTFPAHTLKSMTIKGGSTDDGGGIEITPAKATLKNLVVKKNEATETGGGIRTLSEDLTMIRTTITKNTAPFGAGLAAGVGGVADPVATVKSSTISGNAGDYGAGVAVDGTIDPPLDDLPRVDLINSTVAGNLATANGGGLYAVQSGTLTVDNSTVAYNGANSDATAGGSGGGLYQGTSADFQFVDSIVAENTVGSGGSSPECAGTFIGGGNLIGGSAAGCTIGGTFTINAFISQLANNGGPTKTVAIEEPSEANGLASGCPSKDQRGVKRPNNCDSGSFELPDQP